MDPLSITASVVGLTATCVQTAKALNDLKGKFQNASLTIGAICTETTIISASLSRIQSSMLSDPDDLTNKLSARPDLEATLDHALTGCYVVFDVLQAELQKFAEVSQAESTNMGFRDKLRYVWNEGNMQEILAQLRGLQTALILLLQLLGTDTMIALKQMMDNNTTVLQQIVEKTSRFRTTKASRAPQSIFDMSFTTQSIHYGDGGSVISSTLFSFDDQIVNSQAYRRVLAKASANERGGSSSQTAVEDSSMAAANPKATTNQSLDSNGETQVDAPSSVDNASGDHRDHLSPIAASSSISVVPVLDQTPDDSLMEFMFGKENRSEDWAIRWQIKRADIEGIAGKEVERQNVLHEIITTESEYLRSLQIVRYLYQYRLVLDFSVSQLNDLRGFPGHEKFYYANKTLLHDPLIARQSLEGPWISSVSDIFENWLQQSRGLYIEYAANHYAIDAAIRREAKHNARFARFLDQGYENRRSNRLAWDTYLKSPFTRIQRYCLLLQVVLKNSVRDDPRHKYEELQQLITNLRTFVSECSSALDESQTKAAVDNIRSELGAVGSQVLPSDVEMLHQTEMIYKESRFREGTRVLVLVLRKPNARVVVLKQTTEPQIKRGAPWEILVHFYYVVIYVEGERDGPDQTQIMLRGLPGRPNVDSIVLIAPTRKVAEDLASAVLEISGTRKTLTQGDERSSRTLGRV